MTSRTPQHADWLTACSGKDGFSSFEVAQSVIQRRRRPGRKTPPLHPYRCSSCGKYHIGEKRK